MNHFIALSGQNVEILVLNPALHKNNIFFLDLWYLVLISCKNLIF